MNTQAKVSVVLCCYNQEEYVRHAIESVLNQTYTNTELVVIDNGSTDGTPAILREYETNSRIKVILHPQNAAVTKRLNEGISAASGDFISILYADDYYLPRKIEAQMAAFAGLSEEYGVVYSPGYRLNTVTNTQWQPPGMPLSGQILREMLVNYHRHCFLNPISPLVRKVCLLLYPFRETVFIEGECIYFRIGVKYKFQYLAEPLVVMRDHPTNAGKAIKRTKEYEVALISLWLAEPEFPVEFRSAVCTYLARVLRNYGWQAIRLANEKKWARHCFYEALKWDWKQAGHPRTVTGFALSLLPNRAMNLMNTLGNSLKPSMGLRAFRADNQ